MSRSPIFQRSLASFLAANIGLLQPVAAVAQTVVEPVDTPRPADSATNTTRSANGTPVVNIATPNASGVSHNRFTQYDVGTGGLILNNSATNAVSLLGGGTIGNSNLGNGAANLILNEVVTANAGSQLRGYTEILGPGADLVVANPWGITCDGCGFVNTPRVTLTTGTPALRPDGSLASFTITGGAVAIGADGLDASRQRVLDVLARGITVGGPVFAGSRRDSVSGDALFSAGAQSFDYAVRRGSALAPTTPVAPFAIDSSALGGIYADRIRLLVNEQGAGVRSAGDLAALGDDLTVTADGRIELRGAASAARDLVVQGASIGFALPSSDDYLYAGRNLNLSAGQGIDLGRGSLGAGGSVDLLADVVRDRGGANDLRFAGTGGALSLRGLTSLDLDGGYWTAPRLQLQGRDASIGSNALLYGTGTTGESLGVSADNGLAVAGRLYSGADTRLQGRAIVNGVTGVVSADGALSVNTGAAAGGALLNWGTLAGDRVSIGAATTQNLGTVFAERGLELTSDRLDNIGAHAQIIGANDAAGSARITASTVNNQGTIWSAGDLALTPTQLAQSRAAGATANPVIGAGRDLTIDFSSEAALGTGDLQAGRDLTIRGTTVRDTGSLGAAGATADVRYAGRDLTAFAGAGDVEIAGGQWFSLGGLTLDGESVVVGGYRDPGTGAQTLVPGVQVLGGWGGSGLVDLRPRIGSLQMLGDASVFSGGDLTLRQAGPLSIGVDNVLRADGRLTLDVGQMLDNFGTVSGGDVLITSSAPVPLFVSNYSTGILAGDRTLAIGSDAAPVASIAIEDSTSGGGIFGGALDFHTGALRNAGTLQWAGPSTIYTGSFDNLGTGRALGFGDLAGNGGLLVRADALINDGLIYDALGFELNASRLVNDETGVMGSAGITRLVSMNNATGPITNLGEIWGRDVSLIAARGIVNGRDRGVIANRALPASIYASNTLSAYVVGNSTLQNFGDIESLGDVTLTNLGSGGTVRNEMSMVSAPEVYWLGGGSPRSESGYLGRITSDPSHNGGTRHDLTLGSSNYYYFDDGLHLSNQTAFQDNRATYLEFQYLTDAAKAISRPGIRAGHDLSIVGFGTVTNIAGVLGAANDLTIDGGASRVNVGNQSLTLNARDLIKESTTTYECRTGINTAVSCGTTLVRSAVATHTEPVSERYSAERARADAFAGQIYAGNHLTVVNGNTVANAGVTNRYAGSAPTAPTAATLNITGPNSPGALGNRPTLNVNGAQVPLPTSANGRFVPVTSGGKGPVIETNPLFGLDSIALGSEYLAKLLGLDPDAQTRRLGDDNYEAYLIQEQLKSATGRGVLASYYGVDDMVKSLFDNAAGEAGRLGLGYGKALTAEQVASLKSDIVWMVEQEVKGQKVLVPVVYLSDATRASIGSGTSMSGYNVDIDADKVSNVGGSITAANRLAIKTTGNIENLSGRMSGWNVQLKAGGDIINSTLSTRSGDAANGKDIAQRTATIEAGNTAVLKADRDVNVSGAWVLAGKDAVLIAGRNVTVESQALNENRTLRDGKDSYSRSSQTLQGGGVAAGGNAILQAGNDVDVTGADVSAGGVAALRAERGNVNIGVRELTDASTGTQTTVGRYDQTDADAKAGTLGIGMGKEKKTTTHSETTTVGVGSRVAGKGVQISTGKGDVNVQGSQVAAGEDGLYVDSAGNVNVTAYDDKHESTDSVESVRAGARIDGSYDGIFAGTQVSGDKTTTTATQTRARTSGLTSKGDVVVQAKGDITNQGTQIAAQGDVVLDGERVINKAAQDTSTVTTTSEKWDTKQQTGFTTNGTGSSIANAAKGGSKQVQVNNLEAQARVTGDYSKDTSTTTDTHAQVTGVKAGGNIVVKARGAASDEGTQYEAGKNLVISADSYENKAAADTHSTTTDTTRVGGMVTGGLNSAAEVAVNVSGQGSHDKTGDTQSKAVVGGLKAGGVVVVDARRGDVTLEGTQVEGQKGVGIHAGGDVKLLQANDTSEKTGSGESGSGRVSGSVSVLGTGGSVGAAASGRTYENKETTNTARVASIRSGEGSVQIDAGKNLTSQGTEIGAKQDVSLKAGGDIDLAAATSGTRRTGSADGGGVDATVGFGLGAAKGNGSANVSVDAERSRTDYTESTQAGSNIKAGGQFKVDAGGNARLQGTQVEAGTADLRTGGDLKLESAQHTVKDDSYSVTAHVEGSGSKGGGAGGANSVSEGSSGSGKNGGNAGGGNLGANVSRSKQDIEKNTNATIRTTGATTVNTGGDLTLAGANIDAQGGVKGTVGGDLNIETRVDKEDVNQTNVKAYVGTGAVGDMRSTGKFDKAQDTTQVAANQAGQTGAFTDVKSTKKDNLTVGRASGINGGAGGIDVTVKGDTQLTGAMNSGDDFKTQGQTTVAGVETRTKESKTDFRVAGTVASAAGSDQGKGGDYNFTMNMPAKGPAANRPQNGAPTNAPADAPNGAPASRPRTDGAPAPTPASRPRADSAPAPTPVSRPRSDSAPAPDAQPTRPRTSSAPAELDRRPASTPDTRAPVVDTPYGNVPSNYGNAPNGGSPTPHPTSHPTSPGDDANTSLAPTPTPVLVARVDANANTPPGSRTGTLRGAIPDTVAVPDGAAAPQDPATRSRADSVTPDAERRPQTRPSEMNENDRIAIDRNLREIEAFTSRPAHRAERERMLAALELSLAGPHDRGNGLVELPLRPQFVGEDVEQFASWHVRPADPAKYALRTVGSDTAKQPIRYYDANERAQRMVTIDGGKLRRAADEGPLEDGSYIFVVDAQGRMVAEKPANFVIHHSSLAAGKPVLMAGEFVIEGGRIVEITNKSGHYRPSRDAFERFLADFSRSGADLTQTYARNFDLSTAKNLGFDMKADEDNVLRSTKVAGADPARATMVQSPPVRPELAAPAPAPAPQPPRVQSDKNEEGYHTTKEAAQEKPAPQPADPQKEARQRAEIAADVSKRIGADPELKSLAARMRGVDDESRGPVARNLAELGAFASLPGNETKRARLMQAMEQAIAGAPQGKKEPKVFGLLPQYVGESEPGFNNWATRQRHQNLGVGEIYGPGFGPTYIRTIKYFTPEEQAASQLFVNNDGTVRRGPSGEMPANEKYLFVVDRNGRLLVTKPITNQVHHSSLSAGEPVRMAGQITFENGRITAIDNVSGHFRPDKEAFRAFLRDLQSTKVDLKGAKATQHDFQSHEDGRFSDEQDGGDLLAQPKKLKSKAPRMLAPLKAVGSQTRGAIDEPQGFEWRLAA